MGGMNWGGPMAGPIHTERLWLVWHSRLLPLPRAVWGQGCQIMGDGCSSGLGVHRRGQGWQSSTAGGIPAVPRGERFPQAPGLSSRMQLGRGGQAVLGCPHAQGTPETSDCHRETPETPDCFCMWVPMAGYCECFENSELIFNHKFRKQGGS